MRSSSYGNRLFIALPALLVCGCATSAPDMPAHFDHASEAPIRVGSNGAAQRGLKVASQAWQALTEAERQQIQSAYRVDVFEPESYGLIIDNQAADESTPGTNVGAGLGSAVANAAYIDHAIGSGNYSAKTQLAAGILGAAIGSTMDSKPASQYHFRYTVKMGDGDIQYFDEYKSTPFRHSVGVCVSVPNIALIGQQVCNQTADSIRAKYLKDASLAVEKR